MHPPLHNRRLTRPSAPSCRGGASSLLRLAQPAPRSTAGRFDTWLRRSAAALAPVLPWHADAAAPSIITPLTPSDWLALP